LLDVDEKQLTPVDEKCSIVGASSDMFVLDLNENSNRYKIGQLLEFRLTYMGVLRVLNSKYIEKSVKNAS
jgi:predicted amino acid racemase